jgi:hypothetical protein
MATSTPATKAPAKKAAPKKATGKAVAKVEKLSTDLSPAKAKALNEKIKGGVTNVIGLLNDAYQGRIWLSLGYKDWGAYVQAEFQGAPLQLPTLKRREAVKELVDKGWSVRAIAEVTGASKSAIGDDAATVRDPDTSGEAKTTGLDGKQRDASRPSVTRVPDIIKDATKVAARLRSAADAVDELLGRPDYKGHEVEISQLFASVFDDLWSTTVDLGLDNPMGNPDDAQEPYAEDAPEVIDGEVVSEGEPETEGLEEFSEPEPEPAV